MKKKDELSTAEIIQQDIVDNAIHNMLTKLVPKYTKWDINCIAPIREEIMAIFELGNEFYPYLKENS